MSTPDVLRSPAARLAALFHHRWAVPTLAELQRGEAGGRFAALARRLAVGRPVLTKTLTALGELGLVEKNPGYGHPLRPEYVLTRRGRLLGHWCERFVRTIRRADLEDAALRKWSMPALFAVHRGVERFSDLKESLPGITARALTLALKDLAKAGLIDRVVEDAFPPRVRYRTQRRARGLAKRLDELPAVRLG